MGKFLEGERRTFENDGFLWAPDVAKCPRTLSRFEIYHALPIGENKDLVLGRIKEILDWVPVKIIPVFSREVLIEVRVLLEHETSLFRVPVAAEIPKNF
jgi:hypothetical protein